LGGGDSGRARWEDRLLKHATLWHSDQALHLLGGGLSPAVFAVAVLPRTKRRIARASPCPAAPCISIMIASTTKATAAILLSTNARDDAVAVGSTHLLGRFAFPVAINITSLDSLHRLMFNPSAAVQP
jgi:hypothetical protein